MNAKLPVGILGAAHVHAPGWALQLARHPQAEFAGVYDADPDRTREVAALASAAEWSSAAGLLERVAAVIVSAENRAAPDLVSAAAGAGVHVLCEKPLGATRADGSAMVSACEEAGVSLSTTFEVRYRPAARRLKALVDSGALGDLRAIWATNHGAYPGGWFGDPERSGGGCLIDHVVHVADLVRWAWGVEFSSVHAETATRHNPGLTVEDCGVVLATLSNGATLSLDSSWSRHRGMPGAVDVTIEAVAEHGHVHLDAFADRVELLSSDGHLAYKPAGTVHRPSLLDEWLAALSARRPPPISNMDGYRASEVAWAALESAQQDHTIVIPLDATFPGGSSGRLEGESNGR